MRERKRKPSVKPVLLFNTGQKDREACHLVMSSGMACEFLATGDEDTPKLIDGYQEFTGVEEIKNFVEDWKRSHCKLKGGNNDG